MTHFDLLAQYPAKGLEYGLAVAYLLLFIPFWRYVQGGRRQATAEVHAGAKAHAAEAVPVRPAPRHRLAANLRQLLAESTAQRLMEEASERLALQLRPELGQVLQDGGAPIHGVAQELSGERWDELARTFFLT